MNHCIYKTDIVIFSLKMQLFILNKLITMSSQFTSFTRVINFQSNEHLHISIFFSALITLLFTNVVFGSSPLPKAVTKDLVTISNGAIAYAYPISNIKIDGDISDWPTDLERYSINKFPYGKNLKNKNDFDAYFNVGYNLSEKALYVIVVVTDESHVVDTSDESDWNTQDSFNFYIDEQHSPNGSGVDLYQFSEYFKNTNDQSVSWDPSKKETSWDNIEIISKRNGITTIYECKITLNHTLKAGKSIGIDHVFIDKDADDDKNSNSFIAWGNGGGKSSAPGRLGDVILMKEKEKISTIKGKVVWKDSKQKKYPDQIRFTAKNNSDLWIQAAVDSTGNYTFDIPIGEYIISPAKGIFYSDESQFRDKKLIRIDTQNEKRYVTVIADKTIDAPVLQLSVVPNPDIIPEKGILHDFETNKAIIIDKFINTYQEHYQIPGVSLALIKDGKVVYHKTYGVKNTLTKEKVDDKTLFEAASITKPVFGFAVMRLVERGILNLDKPLYEYLPFEDIAHDDRYKLITARHVMSHKTGFPNWAWMNEDGKIDIKFTPGTKYQYSGEGFEYLKRVVVHITGKDINTILKEEVLTPLGLENTYFSKNDYLAEVVSNGHFDNLPSQTTLPNSPGMAWSMHTEAKTFTNFLLGLSDKKGLKPETYQEMFKVQTEIPKDEKDTRSKDWQDYFGLSIHMQKTPFGPSFGHGGNNGDFRCLAVMYQDLDMGFVVFTNSNTGEILHDDLVEYLITGKQKKK